ncbi:MAG: hypothetical protein KA998_02595, partial [Rickettsiaceae bacterium]|nr:hypothetical protein [Rickettsiaceae bacterium]
ALNVNEGFTKNSRDVGGGENLLKNLIYRDQQSLPVDSRYIALVDLSRIVRENELVPRLINTKGHNKKYNAEQFSKQIRDTLSRAPVSDKNMVKMQYQLRFLNSKRPTIPLQP